MRLFSTRFWLTRGVQQLDGWYQVSGDVFEWFIPGKAPRQETLGRTLFKTLPEAVAACERERDRDSKRVKKKIAKLQGKIEKIAAMRFTTIETIPGVGQPRAHRTPTPPSGSATAPTRTAQPESPPNPLRPRNKREYAAYLRTDHWKAKRAEALAFHGPKCCECGTVEKLHVHHDTYARVGAELMSDLRILCEGCHHKFHAEKRAKREERRKNRKPRQPRRAVVA